jgi:hypothetical protein
MMIFLLEFFTFFRSHRGKLFFKSMLPVAMCPVAMPMSSKTPEKNVGKDKQSDRLPERKHRSVEKIGDKSIPQQHCSQTEYQAKGGGYDRNCNKFYPSR